MTRERDRPVSTRRERERDDRHFAVGMTVVGFALLFLIIWVVEGVADFIGF